MIIGFFALPEKYKARILSFDSYTLKSNSISTRLEVQLAALEQFVHHPVFGVGYGNRYGIFDYYTTYPDKNHAVTPHNAYLQILAQVGIFGLAVLCMFFVKAHNHMRAAIGKYMKQGEDEFVRIGHSLNISMLVALFSGMALDLFDKGLPQIWLIIGLCAAYISLSQNEQNKIGGI
jgi:O-antigen ligase